MNGNLLSRVYERLDLDVTPRSDEEGLHHLYEGWCNSVPFDNVLKMIALRRGLALPGQKASEFFGCWLSSGSGGTCWAGAIAFRELLVASGFTARFAAGSMYDMGLVNHGTVVVSLGRSEWLADSSLISPVPLRLGGRAYRYSNGVSTVELEPDRGGHLLWMNPLHQTGFLNCRIHRGGIGRDEVLAYYEATRHKSAFNQRLYARRNYRNRVILLRGNLRFEQTQAGMTVQELTENDLRESLHADLGFSEELVENWTKCGALADSMKPANGPAPPPVRGVPPSLRAPSGDNGSYTC